MSIISLANFEKQTDLIASLGKGNAHMVWALGLYLDCADLISLAADGLTDGGDDKKIDFLYYDQSSKRIVMAQGYYTDKTNDKAPANKASDLMVAAAWLVDGDVNTHNINNKVKTNIIECRNKLTNLEVDQIDILFIHNLPESTNAKNELDTCRNHIKNRLGPQIDVRVHTQELGLVEIEKAYIDRNTQVIIKKDIELFADVVSRANGPDWEAVFTIVKGQWLKDLYEEHGDDLFSANYRGFLGVGKRRKINSGIKITAEKNPEDFLVFNNGITAITNKIEEAPDGKLILSGISIINGAQTTGSIGGVSGNLDDVKIICRIVKSNNIEKTKRIVQYNNTQNEITTWDQYANDEEQKRLVTQFEEINHKYSLKRGFDSSSSELGIEKIAQPSLAIQGYFTDANRGKNDIFESPELYRRAFQGRSAKKLLFAYCVSRAVDHIRLELAQKQGKMDAEEKLYSLFGYLSFKNYLISLVGTTLEVVVNKKIYIDQVAFNTEYAKKPLQDIVSDCTPIVRQIATLAAIYIGQKSFETIKTDSGFKQLSEEIKVGLTVAYATAPRPTDFINCFSTQ